MIRFQQRTATIFRPVCLSICVAVLLLVRPAQSQSKVYDEYAIKAAYVYNLSKFVAWPGDDGRADEEFQICIYGRDPYGAKIDAVTARMTKGRPIRVIRHGYLTAGSCAIAFIGHSETYKLEEALLFFAELPILTIGEDTNFVDKGGIVALVADRNRVTFEINLEAARAAQLEFSSQLLRVASRLVD